MSSDSVRVRAATAADRAGVLALAPRLAEGVAPWRDQQEAGNAGGRWLAEEEVRLTRPVRP